MEHSHTSSFLSVIGTLARHHDPNFLPQLGAENIVSLSCNRENAYCTCIVCAVNLVAFVNTFTINVTDSVGDVRSLLVVRVV